MDALRALLALLYRLLKLLEVGFVLGFFTVPAAPAFVLA